VTLRQRPTRKQIAETRLALKSMFGMVKGAFNLPSRQEFTTRRPITDAGFVTGVPPDIYALHRSTLTPIDAGQARGEVATADNPIVRGADNSEATLDDLGISRQRLSEWRDIQTLHGPAREASTTGWPPKSGRCSFGTMARARAHVGSE
jgi:hypothetical protein